VYYFPFKYVPMLLYHENEKSGIPGSNPTANFYWNHTYSDTCRLATK
jgi:hypothetical protein